MGILASTSVYGTPLVLHILEYGYFCVIFCPKQCHTIVRVLCAENCRYWVNWGLRITILSVHLIVTSYLDTYLIPPTDGSKLRD
jgi:hypothetical protein